MTPELQTAIQVIVYAIITGFITYREVAERRRRKKIASEQEQRETTLKREVEVKSQQRAASLESDLARRFTDLLESEKRALTEKIDALQRELAEERESKDALRESLRVRDEQVDTLRHDVSDLCERVDAITRERDSATIELQAARVRETTLEHRIEALERERAEMKEKIIRLEAELQAYKTIIEPFFKQLSIVYAPPISEQKAIPA